jgi:hypothetical protein
LTSLLSLGSRAAQVDQQIISNPGPLLPEVARLERPLPAQLRKQLGPARADKIGSIRNAFEAELPPSAAFLEWLLKHPEQLVWPKAGARKREFSPSTTRKRTSLIAGDLDVRKAALEELNRVGPEGSQRKWWAFEGFTSVDCCLKTESLLLLIEGKRTDRIADSTDWFPRNQVIRNLEVAQAPVSGRKNFAVLVCTETPIEELVDEAWTKSLPHLSPAEIEQLKLHYLGYCTWSAIVQQLCPALKLPENIDEAIETCLRFRP